MPLVSCLEDSFSLSDGAGTTILSHDQGSVK